MRKASALFLCLAALAAPARAEPRGKWHDAPADALAAAQKERKPVLAAAMDHG